MHLNMSSAKSRPFFHSLYMLKFLAKQSSHTWWVMSWVMCSMFFPIGWSSGAFHCDDNLWVLFKIQLHIWHLAKCDTPQKAKDWSLNNKSAKGAYTWSSPVCRSICEGSEYMNLSVTKRKIILNVTISKLLVLVSMSGIWFGMYIHNISALV